MYPNASFFKYQRVLSGFQSSPSMWPNPLDTSLFSSYLSAQSMWPFPLSWNTLFSCLLHPTVSPDFPYLSGSFLFSTNVFTFSLIFTDWYYLGLNPSLLPLPPFLLSLLSFFPCPYSPPTFNSMEILMSAKFITAAYTSQGSIFTYPNAYLIFVTWRYQK